MFDADLVTSFPDAGQKLYISSILSYFSANR